MEMDNLSIVEQLSLLRITADSEIAPHEFLYTWNGVPCFARGELVAVTGKAKSGKTYLNSILMATAGALNKGHFLGLKRVREEALRVVWIDTEQSEDSTHEILRDRIGAMTGDVPSEEVYHVFNLRQIRWQERMTLILSAIAICKPDLVIFDGIRDVVGDINNYEEAQHTIGQLLKVASEYRTCIVCVLHQNKAVEDKTLRGALGTELQNKSFETYECAKDIDTRIFTIRQVATRKYDMPGKVQFCVDKEGLPVAVGSDSGLTSEAQDKETQGGGFNSEYIGTDGKIDKAKLFGYILQGGKYMSLAQLRQVVMNVANVHSFNFAFKLIEEARIQGILHPVEMDGKSGYQLSP